MRLAARLVTLALLAACGAPEEIDSLEDVDVGTSEERIAGITCPSDPDLDLCASGTSVYGSVLRIGASATSAAEVTQTFEPTRQAQLVDVVLKLRLLRPLPPGEPELKVHLDLRDASGPVPTGTGANLATTSKLLSELASGDTTFTFPAGGPMLSDTGRYALVLRTDAPQSGTVLVGVASHPADAYAFGESLRRPVRAAGSAPFVSTGVDLSFAIVLSPAAVPTAGVLEEPNVVTDGSGCCSNWLKHWRFRITTSGLANTITLDGWFTGTCSGGCIPPQGSYGFTIYPPAPGSPSGASKTISGYPTNSLVTTTKTLLPGRWRVEYFDFLSLQFDVDAGGKITIASYVDKSRGNADRTSFLTLTNTPQ